MTDFRPNARARVDGNAKKYICKTDLIPGSFRKFLSLELPNSDSSNQSDHMK